MKIAICCRKGSFSDYWLTYCEENGISYKKVDAYQSDIMKQIEDCDAFMWHFSHLDYKDKVLQNNFSILLKLLVSLFFLILKLFGILMIS